MDMNTSDTEEKSPQQEWLDRAKEDIDTNLKHMNNQPIFNTPDTEMEKAELAVFWDEMAQHLPKSIERSALGDEKIFRAFATAYPKIKKHLISSRDTYWKERVRKTINEIHQVDPDDMNTYYTSGQKAEIRAYNQALTDILQALDNLK